MPTTRPQLQAVTMLSIAATGSVMAAAADGTSHSGCNSGVGIVPADDEDDGSLLCSVCMEAPLSILLAPCGHILSHECCASIQAADNLVRYDACMALSLGSTKWQLRFGVP